MAGRSPKTPEERSDVVEKANAKARKGYKINLNKSRVISTDEETMTVWMQLVALKVLGGYSNDQCAAIIGLSRGQVREIVQSESFKKHVATVKQTLPQAALSLGQAYLVEGVQAVAHVLRTETDNGLVLRAAAELFDRFGLPKLTRAEIKNDKPEEDGDSLATPSLMKKLKAASPEIQEQIAALHESFTEGVERILVGGTENGSE